MILCAALVASLSALRIVSLAPALTEDLFAIGAGAQIVGVDSYSIRPAATRDIVKVGSERQINAERILALHPDLVVGIPIEAVALAGLRRAGLRVETLRVDSLEDDLHEIGVLGELTGRRAAASDVVQRLRERLARAHTRAMLHPPLRAFVVVSENPIFTAGGRSFLSDVLDVVNLRNAAQELGPVWPRYSAERLVTDDPDVLIISKRTQLPQAPPWNQLRAVRENRVVRLDEQDFSHPGPSVADLVDDLLAQLESLR